MSRSLTFVHAADLHLDTPFKGVGRTNELIGCKLRDATLAAWERLVSLCVEERADFLLLAGDVYDGPERGLRVQRLFLRGIEKLSQEGVSVFMVSGNHDPLERGWEAISQWPPNVHLFPPEPTTLRAERDGETIALVHGISYARRDTTEDLAAKLKRSDEEVFQIGLVHATVGRREGHEHYAPTTIDTLTASNLDYWALGHVHTREIVRDENPVVAYPGNLQAITAREEGERGALLVRVDVTGGVIAEFKTLDLVRFETLPVDVADTRTVDELEELILAKSEELRSNGPDFGVVVTVELTGRGPLHRELAKPERVSDLLELLREGLSVDEPFLWFRKIRNLARADYDIDEVRRSGGLEGELAVMVDELLESQELLANFVEKSCEMLDSRSKASRHLASPGEGEREKLILEARELALDRLLEGRDR